MLRKILHYTVGAQKLTSDDGVVSMVVRIVTKMLSETASKQPTDGFSDLWDTVWISASALKHPPQSVSVHSDLRTKL